MTEPIADELTERQQRVLSFIEGQIRKHGFPPTIREIGRHLGIRSTNGVNDHLNARERKGFVKRQDHKSRTLVEKMGGQEEAVLLGPPSALFPVGAANDALVEV